MRAIVWVSGASTRIGRALVETVPFDDARVIGISRTAPPGPAEHLEADLADPASWEMVAESFREELAGFDGDAVVFFHAAGTVDPAIGPATVDTGMQAELRETPEEQFPKRQKFVGLHEEGKLSDPRDVARRLWERLHAGFDNGTVDDLRKFPEAIDG
jgi:hypothetical protein